MAAPAEAVQLSSAIFLVFRAYLCISYLVAVYTCTNVHETSYTAYARGPAGAAEKQDNR